MQKTKEKLVNSSQRMNGQQQSRASFCETERDGHNFSDNGEFDPGSGRTLAACFIHASRTIRSLRRHISGGRVSNV